MAVDLPGFGESRHQAVPLRGAPRFAEAVALAADFARRSGMAPDGQFAFVGHSLGAGVVLQAGRLSPRPSSVVALGAPATVARFDRDGKQWLDGFAERRLGDMDLPADFQSIDAMGRYLLELDVLRQSGRSGNPPVLLVKGQMEKPFGIPHLRQHLEHTNP